MQYRSAIFGPLFGEFAQDFEDAFEELFHVWDKPPQRLRALWSPRVDIAETSEYIVVVFELPGVDRDSISLFVDQERLVVTGVRRRKQLNEEHSCRRLEISYGPFERAVHIGAHVDTRGARASYVDGLLEVTLPKVQTPIRQTVRVNIE